ncbi:MAG TPA: hypothetical protein VGY48_04940 [Vicinamibacterales bacterium]|nr:hypothetical protein [Vicinamibacterales bacterium]
MRRVGLATLVWLAWCGTASAQLQTTLILQIDSDPGGISLTGSGTASTSLLFSSVRAYGGTVPSGVTEVTGATSFTLSTTIDIHVFKGSLDVVDTLSTSYTLTAHLQAIDITNTWKFNSQMLTTSSTTITSAGVYNSTPAYSFSLTIPFSEPAGAISNTVQLMVVAN